MNFMYAGVFLALGWLWFYLFIRQLMFNFLTAYPLIKKMTSLQGELIAVGAKRYTHISVAVSLFFSLAFAAAVIAFLSTYLVVCFFIGAAVALIMFAPKLSYKNRDMFDSFCSAYYRFVPDDALRTAMYNKKPSQMKVRLHEMGLASDFIPKFEKK